MIFCTLFNSKYLDRGLVLYESLEATNADFKLYILCMDDLCADILEKQKRDRIIPIKLSEFETQELVSIKGTRSFSEYCWTCTPLLIRYVIEEKKESICTYIDADMFFYNNPDILFDEMKSAGKSVMFVPHNFAERLAGKEKEVGMYCVEFNPFTQSEDSMRVLNEWIDCCIKSCSLERDGVTFGDQKYLDRLAVKYSNIHICSNKGAGVAPWNIDNYSLRNNEFFYNNTRLSCLVFYHFQGLIFENGLVITDIPIKSRVDSDLVKMLYVTYIDKLVTKRKQLNQFYDLDFSVNYSSRFKNQVLKNKIKSLLKKCLLIRKSIASPKYYVFPV